MLTFCRDNEPHIRAAFETQDKVKFPDNLDERGQVKMKVLKYMNPKLEETFGISVTRKHLRCLEYEISKVFKFT